MSHAESNKTHGNSILHSVLSTAHVVISNFSICLVFDGFMLVCDLLHWPLRGREKQ